MLNKKLKEERKCLRDPKCRREPVFLKVRNVNADLSLINMNFKK